MALLSDINQNRKVLTDFNNDFPMPIFMGIHGRTGRN
jgi:hypothetical protein